VQQPRIFKILLRRGTTVFRGTRIPVQTLIDYAEIGDRPERYPASNPFDQYFLTNRISMIVNGGNVSKKKSGSGAVVDFNINVDRWIKYLVIVWVIIELLMVILDYGVNHSNGSSVNEIRRLFNITLEDGLPSFFAVTQATLVALTLWVIWLIQRQMQGGGWRPYGWLIIAVVFSYMAVDDGSRLHERVGTAVKESTSSLTLEGKAFEIFPSYPWQVVFIPFFAVFGLFVIVYLMRTLRRTQSRVFVLTAIALLVGAVGLDFVEGLSEDHPLNIYTAITETVDISAFTERQFGENPYETLVHFSKSIEEFMEMLGNTLLWAVFLRHLADLTDEIRVRLHS